jgi:hypothetical protein
MKIMLDPVRKPRDGAVTARNEGADDYPGIIAILDAETRVIRGACGIQWVVQRIVNRAQGKFEKQGDPSDRLNIRIRKTS